MNLEQMTRQLGAELQKDERYLAYHKAIKANEEDTGLNELMNKVQLVHMSYQHEASKEDKNEDKLDAYEKEFGELYDQVRANPNMAVFEKARDDLDALMKYITGIISLSAQGENPETCEPDTHNCGGECGECSGCSS